MLRRVFLLLLALVASAVLAAGWMYSVATRVPVVRRTSLAMPDWPRDAGPIRVALLTDIQVSGPDMSPSRLVGVVEQVNRLKPDLVLLGGDFVSDKRVATRRYSGREAVAPLAKLKAPLGVVAVLGNHDHWRSRAELSDALRGAGVRLLDNDATDVGPLSLGGVDDAFTRKDDVQQTVEAMRTHPGAKLLLSHSPDVAPKLPSDVTVLLAGHTHCGQIRLPLVGAIATMSAYGDRFACGVRGEGSLRVITSAGLGTSVLPFRLGAAPDFWLITLGPDQTRRGSLRR